MSRILELKIGNFGSINHAKIEVGSVNVIGGINGSGKSTSSNLLYSFLTAVSSEGEYLLSSSLKERLRGLIDFVYNSYRLDPEISSHLSPKDYDVLDELKNQLDDDSYNLDTIKMLYQKTYDFFESSNLSNKEFYFNQLDAINDAIKSVNSNNKYSNIMMNLLSSEFGLAYINNNIDEGHVSFIGSFDEKNDEKSEFILNFGETIHGQFNDKYINTLFFDNVCYVDSFSSLEVLNNPNHINLSYHDISLSNKLKDNSKATDIHDKSFYAKTIILEEKIEEIINGKFEYNDQNGNFEFYREGKVYGMKNASSGIKQIGLIQMLLANRQLSVNDFLIMDEPEVNLHPEWQIKLAEILILLAKELDITVYLNSHSPHFIEALEVFAIKYELKEETHFYLTVENEAVGKFDFKRIPFKNVQKLYDNLGNPYDKLDEIRIISMLDGKV